MAQYVHVSPDTAYRVEFRKIKSPKLEFNCGQMTMVIPKGSKPEEDIQRHSQWIASKHLLVMQALEAASRKDMVKRTQEQFRQLVWRYAEECAELLEVNFYKIRFKKMEERWASCSTAGNLTVNTLMKSLPDHLIEYVVYHEIIHRLEMNHGKNFWRIMKQKYPDPGSIDMELFIYWLMVEKIVK